MTLQEKRNKLTEINYALSNTADAERTFEQDSKTRNYRFMGVYLLSDDPTRVAIEALLRSHLHETRRRLEAEYESTSLVKCDSEKGGEAS